MKQKRIVYIGHAVSNENGKATGGKKGDQTTSEVRIQEWYNRMSGWTDVLRCIDRAKRLSIGNACRDICKNDNVGYTQDLVDRLSLYEEAKQIDFKFINISKPCACDCSSLVSAVLIGVGILVSESIYTGNMVKAIMNTKNFERFTDKKYTNSDSLLEKGDILRGEGHTAIVTDVKVIDVFDRELRHKSKNLMHGDDVIKVQQKLYDCGCFKDVIDGYYGKKTEASVKLYQTLHKLTADGIVGKNTYKAMGFVYEK